MTTPTPPDPILDALNRMGPQAPVQQTWMVTIFGCGDRPSVACSTDLSLAYTHFLQNLYVLAALFPDHSFTIVGNDSDAALMGLSVYLDDVLRLTLQPAGWIEAHVVYPDAVQKAPTSFEEVAPALLSAMARRGEIDRAEAERFLHSLTAQAFVHDVDEPIRSAAITEDAVADHVTPERQQAAWLSLKNARSMLAWKAPLG